MLLKLIAAIPRIGVTDDTPPANLRSVVVTNFTMLAAEGVNISLAILACTRGHWAMLGLQSVALAFHTWLLWLCFRGKHFVACVGAHLFLMLMILVQTIAFGADSNAHIWMFLVPVSACAMFPREHTRPAFVMAVIGITTLVGFEILNLAPSARWGAQATGSPILMAVLGFMLIGVPFYSRHTLMVAQKELEIERQRSDRLLHNILPHSVIEVLKKNEGVIADRVDSCSVLFSDIVGFTKLSQKVSADELVRMLNALFSDFDDLCEKHGVEKIKTIGDAYMVAAGIPTTREDHADVLVQLGLDMQDALTDFQSRFEHPLDIRIGIHSGPVVAGVIGKRKFAYDLWGDTVNTASRMESHGIPGRIQISEATRVLLQVPFVCTDRGEIEIKGKGLMHTYLIDTHEQPTNAV